MFCLLLIFYFSPNRLDIYVVLYNPDVCLDISHHIGFERQDGFAFWSWSSTLECWEAVEPILKEGKPKWENAKTQGTRMVTFSVVFVFFLNPFLYMILLGKNEAPKTRVFFFGLGI